VSQGNSVTVDVSTRSKCHSGRNVGGRNVKAPREASMVAGVHYTDESYATLVGNLNSLMKISFSKSSP
jgi:hypothetical protein